MPITIDFLSNVSQFLRGTRNAEDALDDVADSLDDVAKEAQRSGDDVDDSLKDSERSAERLERSFQDLADEARAVGKAGSAAGSDVDDGMRKADDGVSRAGDGLGEFKDEANSTAREAAASFDGSAESIGDAFQEVAANAFAGFGPAGAIAGLAAAAGIGLVIQGFEAAEEEQTEFRERVAELAQQFIETGGIGERSFSDMADELRGLVTESEDGRDSIDDLSRIAEHLDRPLRDVVKAYQDGGPALDNLIARQKEFDDQAWESRDVWSKTWDVVFGSANGSLTENIKLMQGRSKTVDQAIEKDKLWAESGGEAMQIKADLVDSVSDAYDGVRDSATDAATSEEGVFDVERWAQLVADQKVQVEAYNENLGRLKLTPDQWTNLMAMPEDARMAIVQSLVRGPQDAKPGIIAALTDAGSSAANSAEVSFEQGFDPNSEVDVSAETAGAERSLRRVTGAKRSAGINAVAHTDRARRQIDRIANPWYQAKVNVSAETWLARLSIWALRNEASRPINIPLRIVPVRSGSRNW